MELTEAARLLVVVGLWKLTGEYSGDVVQKRRTYRFIILKEKSLHLASVAHQSGVDSMDLTQNIKAWKPQRNSEKAKLHKRFRIWGKKKQKQRRVPVWNIKNKPALLICSVCLLLLPAGSFCTAINAARTMPNSLWTHKETTCTRVGAEFILDSFWCESQHMSVIPEARPCFQAWPLNLQEDPKRSIKALVVTEYLWTSVFCQYVTLTVASS